VTPHANGVEAMTAGALTARPRIALLSNYFGLFDEQMPPDFRARMEAKVSTYRDVLARDADVVVEAVVASEADARSANTELRRQAVEAVVVVPTMAAPPAHVAGALDGVDAPVVLWNAPTGVISIEGLDQALAHEETTLVASVMLANVFTREGRSFSVVTAQPSDDGAVQRVGRAVRAAVVAVRLQGMKVLRVGEAIDGYSDVLASDAELAAIGVREVPVSRERLLEAFDATTGDDLQRLRDLVYGLGWEGAPDERSLRAAAAIVSHVAAEKPGCGTVNCHGPYFRFCDEIGISACLAVSLLSTAGVPFSCTGDTPTAIALAIGKALTGAALYCEFYSVLSFETGTLLLANGGEGDGCCARGRVSIVPSSHYPGVNGAGAAVTFALEPGPATVISLSPGDHGWTLAWGAGFVEEGDLDAMGAPAACFRFVGGAPDVDAWIASGATHHHALVCGHLHDELLAVARALGARPVAINQTREAP
jgi:L-arabinose isomerase